MHRSIVLRRRPHPAVEHRVIGVDQSLTCTGIAYFDGGELKTSSVNTSKLRGMHRVLCIRNTLLAHVDYVDPTLVVMEGYSLGTGRGRSKLADLAELGGVLRFYLWSKGIDVMIVPPATLKSLIANNGRADKDDIRRSLLVDYGYSIKSADEADATALLLIGEARCKNRKLKAQASRIAAVNKCDIHPGQIQLSM